ncbi:MAG: hypothetical protein ACHQJ6_07475 [Candidatus Berkiellales bacterium]
MQMQGPQGKSKPRHLTRLPPKSAPEDVAPGDVIGGMIYVIDKPIGIEEGMIGISVDDPVYRQYVAEQLALLKNRKHPDKDLQKRFNRKEHRLRNAHTLDEEIDALIHDKKPKKYYLPLSRTDLRNIFFRFGKLHDVKGGTTYTKNIGFGGLLFDYYQKEKCKINPKKDSFGKLIGKLTGKGSKVYMVKQDAKMVMGRTGPGVSRIMKTATTRKIQWMLNPFVAVASLGILPLVFGVVMGVWRADYLRKNKPTTVNGAAIIETVSTKLAARRGFPSQEIETIEGTYKDGSPKIGTVVTWSPGCRDLTGKIAGGKSTFDSVMVSWDDEEEHIKVDAQGFIIFARKENDKIIGYEKIDPKNPQVVMKASKKEYKNASAVSNDRVKGPGSSLLGFIGSGDRDGIGKMGQNKAVLPIKGKDGKDTGDYQFYGIDFGKSYQEENKYIGSLKDDFSFKNPPGANERMVNISALYDNPLREKMKPVYLLAALHGKISREEIKKIAEDYESTDPEFAKQLRRHRKSTRDKNQGAPNKHKYDDRWLIKQEENNYRDLAQKALDAGDKKKQKEFLIYANRLQVMYDRAQKADEKVLEVFDSRMHLTPTEIDLLENLEKLTAKEVYTTTPDGKVKLNHLRVEPKDRVSWQIKKNDDGTIDLVCGQHEAFGDLQQRLDLMGMGIQGSVGPDKVSGTDEFRITIPNETALIALSKALTEEKIAAARGKQDFRTQAQRDAFHAAVKADSKRREEAKHPQPAPAVQPAAPPISPEPQPAGSPMPQPFVQPAPPSAQPPEQTPGARRKAPVVTGYSYTPTREPASSSQSVLSQNNGTALGLREFIRSEQATKLLRIDQTQFETLNRDKFPTETVVIPFKKDADATTVNAVAKDLPDDGGRDFGLPRNLTTDQYDFGLIQLCRLVMYSAPPYSEIEIPVNSSTLTNKAAIEAYLKDARSMAIRSGIFEVDSAPRLPGDPPRSTPSQAQKI